MTLLLRRLRALALLLVFLGGGTSVPGLDLLLFHRDGETSRSVAHVETDSGCASHAGHCGIGCPASAADAIGGQAVTDRFGTLASTALSRSFAHTVLARAPRAGFHSRAPPAVPA